MANLFELISGLKDKVQDSVLYNRLVGNNTGSGIEIDPVIVDNNGNMDYAGILEAKQKTTPTTLKEKLFGRTMSLDGTKVNQNDDGTYNANLETYSNRRPGLLSDISSGYNENRFNPIAISNLTDNTTQDGRQKGFAYRLGEGLGSLARLAESPIGRGLLMGGTVLATNGSPLQALTYGTVTAAGNQGNRMKDKVYRNSLIDDYKNSLQTDPNYYKLSETEQNKIIQEVTNSPEYNAENITDEQRQQILQAALDDGLAQKQAAMQEQIDNTVNNITGLRGYLNDNTYKNLISQKQLKDNAAYRNLMLEAQQRNLDENREWRKQQAETSRQQAEWNRENQNRELAYKYAALRQKAEQDKAKNAIDLYNATHPDKKDELTTNNIFALQEKFSKQPEIKNYKEIKRQYNNVKAAYEKYKNKEMGTNALDQVLITTLNKITDPISVVRESEFARTAAGQSLLNKAEGYLQKLQKGGSGLNAKEREDVYNMINTLYNANEQAAQQTVADYTELSNLYGVDPYKIMPGFVAPPNKRIEPNGLEL